MNTRISLWEQLVCNSSSLPPVNRCETLLADAERKIVDNKAKVTEAQLRRFLAICLTKYIRAKIEPGMYLV
jgi:hypothetical protein